SRVFQLFLKRFSALHLLLEHGFGQGRSLLGGVELSAQVQPFGPCFGRFLVTGNAWFSTFKLLHSVLERLALLAEIGQLVLEAFAQSHRHAFQVVRGGRRGHRDNWHSRGHGWRRHRRRGCRHSSDGCRYSRDGWGHGRGRLESLSFWVLLFRDDFLGLRDDR